MIECDVAIVGAGPAGCSAARECIRQGLKAVIVEKKKSTRHKACSGILVPDLIKLCRNISEIYRRKSRRALLVKNGEAN